MKNAVFNFPVPANEPVKSYPARHTVDYRRQGDPHRQHRKGGHAS